jgi:anti-sigma regulatory factor (Ser/Thr protein kinase)
MQRIEVAGPTALGDAVASSRRYAVDHGLGARDEARLCIIVEELVANILEHGDGTTDRKVGLELLRDGPLIRLIVEDDGNPFDPRSARPGETVPARGGGAGLRLVKAWSEIVDYQSGRLGNRLELRVPLTGG